MSQFHYGSIQMKGKKERQHRISSLNSTMVRFKYYKFMNGKVKVFIVSIPLWFDSNKVTKDKKTGLPLVSIPLWFDSNETVVSEIQLSTGLNSTMVRFKSLYKSC